jgi:hypothetical protein
MQQQIEAIFPQITIGNCLEATTKNEFEICDSEIEPKRCYIKTDTNEEGQFVVNNPNETVIYLLKIDKCVLFDYDITHFDFAIFDNKTFCFVELSISNKRNRRGKREKAIEQLASTIELFNMSGISFGEHKLEAIICFKAEKIYPSRSASNNEAYVYFESEFNAELLEGNQKEFK